MFKGVGWKGWGGRGGEGQIEWALQYPWGRAACSRIELPSISTWLLSEQLLYLRSNGSDERLLYELRERVGLNGLNSIQSLPPIQHSNYDFCSDVAIFIQLPVASDFIITAELCLKGGYRWFKKGTQRKVLFHQGWAIGPLHFCLSKLLPEEKKKKNCPLFYIPERWFAKCDAFCQACSVEIRGISFSLFHTTRQYYSRLSFRRPERAGEGWGGGQRAAANARENFGGQGIGEGMGLNELD